MDQPQINPQIPMMQMDQPSISEDSNGPTYKYLLFQMKVLLQIAEYNTQMSNIQFCACIIKIRFFSIKIEREI